MSVSIVDIEGKIEHETQLCISRKKNQPFFKFAWMRSRRSHEAGCRDGAIKKYSAELAEAQKREREFEDEVRAEFAEEAQGDYDNIIKLVALVFVFVLAIAWVVSD